MTAIKDLADADQFDVEQQGSVRWDLGWTSHWTVGQIAGDRKLPAAANFHRQQALIPALNDLAHSDAKVCGCFTVGTVKHGAVFERTRVMDRDGLAHAGTLTIANLQLYVLQTGGCDYFRPSRVGAIHDYVEHCAAGY